MQVSIVLIFGLWAIRLVILLCLSDCCDLFKKVFLTSSRSFVDWILIESISKNSGTSWTMLRPMIYIQAQTIYIKNETYLWLMSHSDTMQINLSLRSLISRSWEELWQHLSGSHDEANQHSWNSSLDIYSQIVGV
jgi:hypothetical protein